MISVVHGGPRMDDGANCTDEIRRLVNRADLLCELTVQPGTACARRIASHVLGVIAHADLNPRLERWLDRIADAVTASGGFPDMRPLAAVVAEIVAKIEPAAAPAAPNSPVRSASVPS